jgi:hypothetical protein
MKYAVCLHDQSSAMKMNRRVMTMNRIDRRQTIIASAAAIGIAATAVSVSGELTKPPMTEKEAKQRIESLVYSVYEDAKKYDVRVAEEPAAITKEIWPNFKSILERHFVITPE